MTTALDLFPSRVAFVDPRTGRLTAEAIRALNVIFERVGGASGSSTNDLAITDDDDSGLEEMRSEFTKAIGGLQSAPLAQAQVQIEQLQAEVGALRDQLAELTKQIQGIEQGTVHDGNS